MHPPDSSHPGSGLARTLSKLGYCSRSQAWTLIKAGRVKVNGSVVRDAEKRIRPGRDRIEVDDRGVQAEAKIYLMLNKPRGLVTTAVDEQGRDTVFQCLGKLRDNGGSSPHLFPVGRLDKASEGLLLFTNDTAWAARITDPETHLDKVYHVQIDSLANDALLRRLVDGVGVDGELLRVKRVSRLREGEKNSWLEIVLDEGRNRHIRRLLEALQLNALRLIRVTIGRLQLGTLAKGEVRRLTTDEVRALSEDTNA